MVTSKKACMALGDILVTFVTSPGKEIVLH